MSRSVTPVSGSCVVTTQRPTSPFRTIVGIADRAPACRATRPPRVPRRRRSRTASGSGGRRPARRRRPPRAAARASARETSETRAAAVAAVDRVLAPTRAASAARRRSREIASSHGPSTRRDGCGCPYSSAPTGSPSSTTPSTIEPSGKVSASSRVSSSHSGRDAHHRAVPLVVEEPAVRVDEPEAPVARARRLRSSSTSSGCTQPERLHRRDRDADDAGLHAEAATLRLAQLHDVRLAAPARSLRGRRSRSRGR